MPQKVNCHKCGKALYEGDELKTPVEILQIYNDKCPKCGEKLTSTPINVRIGAAPKYTERTGIK